MSNAPRELRELFALVRTSEPGSNNIGEYLAANAEELAPFLNATPANLRSTAALRDEDVAPKLRHRLEGITRGAEDERRARRRDRAVRGAATLGTTARWTEQGAVLEVEVLLRDVLADRSRRFIAFKGYGVDVPIRRRTLVQVASLRRLHIDLVAFVNPDGLHFRWKGGRGGYNWKPQVVLPADDDRILTVLLRPAHPASAPARPGAWLGEVLREVASLIDSLRDLTIGEKKLVEQEVQREAGTSALPEHVSLYGFLNGVTAAAHHVLPARRLELESLAGELLVRHTGGAS